MEKTGGSRPKRERGVRGTPDGFSRSETKRMEDLLKDSKDDILDESFHQKLTEEFNRAPSRAPGRTRNGPIQMEQVQDWFKKRKNSATDAAKSPISSEETVHVSDASLSNNAPESSSDMPTSKDNGEKSKELEELEFEARSARDMAWYDVATFLAHRILSTGEPEVRVRYNGFGAEEDEWVNVKNDIRERSIPLESSECQRVEVGDLVLCFQERSDQAMYFDAHVLDIERKTHDIRGCRCNFLIRYDHDQTEEKVTLRRLCRRPKY